MDLYLVIALNMMAVSAVASAFALLYRPAGWRGWLVVHVLVIVSGIGTVVLAPAFVAWVVGGLFGTLVVLPLSLTALAQKAARRGAARFATRLGHLASLLHPSREHRFSRRLADALSLPSSDAVEDELAILRHEATAAQLCELEVFVGSHRLDWERVLAVTRSPDCPRDLRVSELRALGELGRLSELAVTYEKIKSRLIGGHFATAQLFLFAFGGREARVDALLKGPLSQLPVDGKLYWRAIARRAAHADDPMARTTLEDLAAHAVSERTRRAASRQLSWRVVAPLDAAGLHSVAAADARSVRELALRPKPLKHLIATPLLMAANLGMLAWAHFAGGMEELDVLFELGALWPPAIAKNGEWWRLLAASFLHLGPIHLAVNLFMLMLFGRIVESRFGIAWMTVAYAWCAVGSMALVYVLMHRGWIETNVLVGASGAIFGLLGVMTAVEIATWLRSRDRLDLNRLGQIAGILILQTIVDFSIQNVSFAAHACGFLLGLVAGSAIVLTRARDHPS